MGRRLENPVPTISAWIVASEEYRVAADLSEKHGGQIRYSTVDWKPEGWIQGHIYDSGIREMEQGRSNGQRAQRGNVLEYGGVVDDLGCAADYRGTKVHNIRRQGPEIGQAGYRE